MNCPNCGCDTQESYVCANCNVDIVLFQKIKDMSNSLYNTGLEQAKKNDLSGAVVTLNKSIEFDKKNIEARNLLGLVYYELGKIGDALKHWVISSSYKPQDNVAVTYIENIQKNDKPIEKQNEAIAMYNQALSYIKQKSEDLAIIQLRRALEFNNKFVDALNLMALCYITQNEKEKAKSALEKVLELDVNNAIALSYYREVFGKVRPDAVAKTSKQASASRYKGDSVDHIKPKYTRLSPSDQKSYGNNFHIPEIISFIVGGALMVAIFYILVMPAKIEDSDKKIQELNDRLIRSEASYTQMALSWEEKTKEVTDENEKLNDDIAKLQEDISLYEKVNKINQMETLFKAGNYEEVIDLAEGMDYASLPADAVEKFESIKEQSYAALSKFIYDEGVKNYNAKKYAEAMTQIEAALDYSKSTDAFVPNAIYLLGVMADNLKDYDTAIKYYSMVVEEYPSTTQATRSRTRLRSLER